MPTEILGNITLRPEELLLNAIEMPQTTRATTITPLEALQILASAQYPHEIGTRGPLLAAFAFPENKERSDLRRFEAFFARDSLIVAYFLLDHYPALVKATLLKLAQLQGTNINNASQEEPGKIIHEAREPNDPIAHHLTATHGWAWPYYGSIDATPLFIRILARYVKYHDPKFLHQTYLNKEQQEWTMLKALEEATKWIITKLEATPAGLVESVGHNQSWKDSPDSYHHSDGTLANLANGIAPIEVQAYAHDALRYASQLLTNTSLAEQASRRAEELRNVILTTFWVKDDHGAYFALGSDRDSNGQQRLLNVRTSNMGHLLTSQVLDGDTPDVTEKKRILVQELTSPALLTEYGIRTLAKGENRFRPTSYHNGSIWPWDSFYISLGMHRQGFSKEARDLQGRIQRALDIAQCFPEFVSGEDQPPTLLPHRQVLVRDTMHNFDHLIEQPPQEIQAWTVAAAFAIEKAKKA